MRTRWYLGMIVAIWLPAAFRLAGNLPTGASPHPVGNVSPPTFEVGSLTVAQAPSGALWAAWEVDTGTDSDIYYSRQVGGEWLAPAAVHRRPQTWDRDPSLIVSANGTPWLAWSTADGAATDQRRVVVCRWSGGRWTDPEAIPQGGAAQSSQPTLAAAPDGTVWLAWVGFDGTDDEVFAQRWDGQGWSRPEQVSRDDQAPEAYDRQPRLAAGANGQTWLVWTGHQDGADDEIHASHWTGAGWSSEQMVSQDDHALDTRPDVALDAQGQPWVVWEARMADEAATGPLPAARDALGEGHLRILVSRWDRWRSTWKDEERVPFPAGAEADARSPALWPDGQGRMHIAWITTSNGASTFAHTWSEAEPRVIGGTAGVDEGVIAVVGDSARLFWLPAAFRLTPTSVDEAPLASAAVDDSTELLASWIANQSQPQPSVNVQPAPNKYLAFGDSITWGQYPVDAPFYPYPSRLDDTLDRRVTGSTVVNAGVPGEGTRVGANRIKDTVKETRPKYVLFMEGTNDVSRDLTPAEVYDNLVLAIRTVRKDTGVENVEMMLATIIPRLDDKNPQTAEMNRQAIMAAATDRSVPLCNPWQAFYDYGPWQQLYWDEKHPNQEGLNLLADTFYQCILASFDVHEETTPPTTWVEPLPPQSECGLPLLVRWDGTDNLSWVASYDVQAQVNGGEWADWLTDTAATSGTYVDGQYNDRLGFRVRGRDLVGNQSDYGTPTYTQISLDPAAPYEVRVNPLLPLQLAPLAVSWAGRDACSGVSTFDVQYSVGASGPWLDWLTGTPNTSGSFDPPSPQYGEPYSFRVRAHDAAGNVSDWSVPQSTVLARFTLSGEVANARHEPIALAQVSLTPPTTFIQIQAGRYTVYLLNGGSFDLAAGRQGFGQLPAMHLSVANSLSGLDFVLPPADDAVSDGGFEAGAWGAWQPGGTPVPTLTAPPHTGDGAVLMGGVGGTSWVSQTLSVPSLKAAGAGLERPTLSFLVRLDDDADLSSTLYVDLVGTAIRHTQVVPAGRWIHVWIPVDAAVGREVTLTFTVDDAPAVRLDEVSLGSAARGGYWIHLPLTLRAW